MKATKELDKRPSTHRGTLAYIPALDGLRALAVVGVILFHFGVDGVNGGFLGVDVFFVISGYLITTLLLSEAGASGSIRLSSFWGRRARRLLPALAVTIIAVSVAAALLDSPSQLSSIRSDGLATLFYVANWHFIISNQHYFSHFGPVSPLLHTWSLAVEEQFYLIWPLIVFTTLALCRRRQRTNYKNFLLAFASTGAILSAIWMAILYKPGTDTSRIYFGTDTHCQVILVGVVLALIKPEKIFRSDSNLSRSNMLPGILSVLAILLSFHYLTSTTSFLYRGGFLVVSIASALLIGQIVANPHHIVGRLLSLPPIKYIGRISYGLYLYHWPIFIFLNEANTKLSGWELLSIRVISTLAISVVSFHLIETPIRKGFNGKISAKIQARLLLPTGAVVTLAVLLLATTLPVGATPQIHKPNVSANTHPAVVLLVGDSVALTLGIGLSNPESRYHVNIINQGQLGCSIAQGNPIMVQGNQDTLPPCNPITKQTWPIFWNQEILKYHPDVVAIELGRWEVVDRVHDGHWTHIGDKSYDQYLTNQLRSAVQLASAHGAKVALLSAPYYNDGESPAGVAYDENQPERVNIWNKIVRNVAQEYPHIATVINVGAMLSENHRFSFRVDNVAVRCPDGVHVSYQGGELVAAQILPTLFQMGFQAYESAQKSDQLSPVAPFVEPNVPKSGKDLARLVQDKSSSPTCPF